MSAIGPTFGSEIIAAGLGGLPFSWSDDGTIRGRENLTAAQNLTLDNVIAAHSPLALTIKQQDMLDTDMAELLNRLRSATPAQIKSYVQNNVTDLTSAKVLLAKILLVLGAL